MRCLLRGANLFGVQPDSAYLIFKYAVVAQAPIAIAACWVLARDISGSLYTATIAALLVALSPVFVLYGGQVMTDVPSVLVLATAFVVHIRGVQQKKLWLILLGAGLMGSGREPARDDRVLHALARARAVSFSAGSLNEETCSTSSLRVWSSWCWRSAGLVTGISLILTIAGCGMAGANRCVKNRRAIRSRSANLRPYFLYYFISAPIVFLTLLFAPVLEWRKRRLTPILLLWAVGFFANLLLFFNYSTTVNWRYFLTGLPAIVPLGAFWMLRVAEMRLRTLQRAFIASIGIIVLMAVVLFIYMRPISFEFIERRAMSREYRHRLEHVPRDAVMISGSQTIAVHYWAAISEGDWKTIGTGGGWPGDRLYSVIDNYFQEGRRVFIDTDPRWWLPCGWQRDELPMTVGLEEQFSFRKVSDTIYELRPKGDPTAQDHPNLKRLLPENRPEDTKKCPPARS